MILTEEIIFALASDRGGYTRATLVALNVPINADGSGVKGWRRDLIGTQVTDEQYQRAVEGRSIYVNRKRQRRLNKDCNRQLELYK